MYFRVHKEQVALIDGQKKLSGRGIVIAHPRHHWPLFVLVLLKHLSVTSKCKLELHTHKHTNMPGHCCHLQDLSWIRQKLLSVF